MEQRNRGPIGLRGYLIDTPVFGQCRSWRDGGVVIENGRILEVGDYDTLRKQPRPRPVQWRNGSNMLIIPGLIDVHAHLPQYPAVGRGGMELLPWLRQNIFPLERDFTVSVARREAPLFFAELARNGTTTAMLYSTIFEESCQAGFVAAEKSGLRIILGKVMMDVGSYGPHQPRKILSISVSETERLCKQWHGADHGRIEYAVSPRFAVSCSERILCAAAELAQASGAYVQTHLAENREELERVRNLFPQAKDYTDVYERCGLLGAKTILGHCIHLSDREIERIASTGSAVAHCPTSNLFLGSGIMKLDQLQNAGIRIGLGSDVAAGPELSLWRVMRCAVESQQARAFYEPEARKLKPVEAFYLATQGGAEALGKGSVIGTFDSGKEADLVVVDPAKLVPYAKRVKEVFDLPAEEIIALCVYRGGPDAVVESYVRGKLVYSTPHPEFCLEA